MLWRLLYFNIYIITMMALFNNLQCIHLCRGNFASLLFPLCNVLRNDKSNYIWRRRCFHSFTETTLNTILESVDSFVSLWDQWPFWCELFTFVTAPLIELQRDKLSFWTAAVLGYFLKRSQSSRFRKFIIRSRFTFLVLLLIRLVAFRGTIINYVSIARGQVFRKPMNPQ